MNNIYKTIAICICLLFPAFSFAQDVKVGDSTINLTYTLVTPDKSTVAPASINVSVRYDMESSQLTLTIFPHLGMYHALWLPSAFHDRKSIKRFTADVLGGKSKLKRQLKRQIVFGASPAFKYGNCKLVSSPQGQEEVVPEGGYARFVFLVDNPEALVKLELQTAIPVIQSLTFMGKNKYTLFASAEPVQMVFRVQNDPCRTSAAREFSATLADFESRLDSVYEEFVNQVNRKNCKISKSLQQEICENMYHRFQEIISSNMNPGNCSVIQEQIDYIEEIFAAAHKIKPCVEPIPKPSSPDKVAGEIRRKTGELSRCCDLIKTGRDVAGNMKKCEQIINQVESDLKGRYSSVVRHPVVKKAEETFAIQKSLFEKITRNKK